MALKSRKYTAWKIVLLSFAVAVGIMFGFVVYDWWQERRAHFVRYQEFGIEIPTNYSIHGIDVSKYQDVIDWTSVKGMNVAGVQMSFVFIKATEGLGNEDSYFQRNWKKTKDAGLARGAYHFFLATKSGKAQAENFINSVDLEPGDMPPVLDIEQTYGVSGEKLRERAKEFLQTVQDHYHVTPIIYTNVDFYKAHLRDDFDGYPLWIAHYLQKERPSIYREWAFWQHSESGRVNGIVTRVDFDVFNGDTADFRKILIN
ncbi:MAG: glycoside hydrolase family 25 protein [Bacteroidetes bacterium]|nr:glycoside hydrolase family 25 protein [Bacteroidota bacterium]